MSFFYSRLNKLAFALACLCLASFLTQASPRVSLNQQVVDVNGGEVEIGDVLEYTIRANNHTLSTLEGAELSDLIPLGAAYVPGSFAFIGEGEGRVLSENTASVLYEQAIFRPGDEIVISYQVVVKSSPLYFVDNVAKPSILYEVDKATGAVNTLDRFAGQNKVNGLALSSDAQFLYGVSSESDTVFEYDLATKTTKVLGPLNLGTDVGVPCLDFNNNGVLIGADSKENQLFSVDLQTGQGTKIADLEVDIKGGDCAFGAAGQLYTLSNNNAKGKAAFWVVNPLTGDSRMVASISLTEYMTGLALDVDGKLYASGNKTDTLWSVDPQTGVGTVVGAFGSPHNAGDLAMAASQKLKLRSVAVYTDNNGNHETNENNIEIGGNAPGIGNEAGGPAEALDIIELEQDYCLQGDEDNCVLPINFSAFMNQYIDSVIDHHFGQVEEVAGAKMSDLNLKGRSAISYLAATNRIILNEKAAALAEVNQMVAEWIAEYDGCNHACPHENILLQNIREVLTHKQAIAAVKVKRHQRPQKEMQCALYGQDSLIRLGDTISLGWDTHEATNVMIAPFVGAVEPSGSLRVRPLETNQFTLTATSEDGDSITCNYTIVVEPACDVGAHKKVIKRGTGTTLFWNGEGHEKVVIDGFGEVAAKSERYVTPTVTTTYALTGYLPNSTEPNKTCDYTIEVVEPEDYCPDNPE